MSSLAIRKIILLLSLISIASAPACKSTPREITKAGDGANEDADASPGTPEDQCFESGGSFDSNTDECRCPSNKTQVGYRCFADGEVPVGGDIIKKDCEDTGGEFIESDKSCECSAPKTVRAGRCVESDRSETDDCVGAGGDWDELEKECSCPNERIWDGQTCKAGEQSKLWDDVEDACKKAKGTFNDKYCGCPDKKVFDGSKCTAMTGGITEATCEDTVSAGTFSSKCTCSSSNDIFSPARGGCMPRVEFKEKTLKEICSSSLNGGTWKDDEDRCLCPDNKIWHNEVCYLTSVVSAVDVCEADYNGGKWESADNTCRCRNGFAWQGKACVMIKNLEEKLACKASFNGGKWDADLKTCNCPDNKGWVSSLRTCAVGAQTAAQQLCIQSGGQPGEPGVCNCGSGLITKVQAPQNYQYCAKDDNDEMPLWLLILLGLAN